VLKRDPEAQKHLPKVMKEDLKKSESKTPGSTRQFSTSARRRKELTPQDSADGAIDAVILSSGTQSLDPTADLQALEQETDMSLDAEVEALPPLKPEDVFTKRYPAIIDQLVGQVMVHGKKSVAQKVNPSTHNLLNTI
jgi:hypothetical protein